MPSARKHLRNAERHYRAAIMAAGDDDTRSWAAVALFYSSHQLVHAVLDGERALAIDLRHPESHGGQEGTSILVSRLYRSIAIPYKSLFGTGKAVRYMGQRVIEEEFRGLRDIDFDAIRDWAVRRLRDQGRNIEQDFLTT